MKKILIIDGNALVAENLKKRLAGIAEAQVLNSLKELDQAITGAFDAIVCDSTLEALPSIEFWSRLKAHTQPVFLYSDHTEIVEGDSWRQAGLAAAFSRAQRPELLLALSRLPEAVASIEASEAPASLGASALIPSFLLVEDSATVRTFVRAVLNQAYPGAQTIEAADGRSALAAMKSSRVSLIVTDLQMPGMDGLSFVQLLRNNSVLKKKPVLVLSGMVTAEARESLSHLDRVEVLAKPASPERLIGAVRSLLA